jgi:hypothetical protein
MAQLPQVLEVPPAYGGGAGLPSNLPSRHSTWLEGLARDSANALLGQPRKAVGAMIRGLGRDCCPCPGQQGRGVPQDQRPYSEPPGLGQPVQPQKPFQGSDKDPCEEALARAGIDIDCLRQAMGRAPKRRAAKPKAKRKAMTAKRRFTESELFWGEDAPRRRKKAPTRKASSKKRMPAKRSLAPRVTRGKYQILQNGACYDPVRRLFVKRALCR